MGLGWGDLRWNPQKSAVLRGALNPLASVPRAGEEETRVVPGFFRNRPSGNLPEWADRFPSRLNHRVGIRDGLEDDAQCQEP